MGDYSISVLVVVIVMTLFIEFYLFKFELLRGNSAVDKRR
jgi:preprotein translocase subunit SecE